MENSDRWLSVEEIAIHLGIKKDTVYKWVTKKHMPLLVSFHVADLNGMVKFIEIF